MIGGLVARHSLRVHRAPVVDDGRGNLAADWSQAGPARESKGWALDVGNTVEDTANRDGAMVEYTARGPFAADVRSTDRIELFGEMYGVSGDVRRQPGPTPRTSHTILTLTKWTG